MATFTSNFALTKPDYGEAADIAVINGNTDEIDEIMHDNRYMMARAWRNTKSYVVGDFCIYENEFYKCTTATSGNWDAACWEVTTLAENLGGTPEVSKTATGNPIELTDAASAPMVRCVTEIQGYQSGSGTPSPDNVRPIVAFSQGDIVVRGKNIADQSAFVQGSINGTGDDITSTIRLRSPLISVLPNNNYAFSTNSELLVMEIHRYDSTGTWQGFTTKNATSTTYTVPNGTYYIKVLIRKSDNSTIIPSELTKFQMETGSSATTFEPFTSTTHTTTYPTAIYRGSEDVTEGKVTSEWGYIASYAGEALPGEWISDRDEYVAGTTPTTGAQVAYALSTTTTTTETVSNAPIRTLSGYTHIASTTGEMEVEYITKEFEPIIKAAESELGEKYSTSERVVGKWIDGKPIYEQTIIFQNAVNLTANTFTNVYDLSTLNVKSLVEITPYTDNVAPLRPFGYFIPDITSAKMLRMNVPNVGWYIGGMTIRYTKTTD